MTPRARINLLKQANLVEGNRPFSSSGTIRVRSESVSLLGDSGGDGGREGERAAELRCSKWQCRTRRCSEVQNRG
jgi:hypothetical protein